MGGIVAFKWDEQQFTLLQNRDNWEAMVINEVNWEGDREVLGSWYNSDKTWFGVSRQGRLAFVVDSALYDDGHGVNDVWEGGAAILTTGFLMNPFMNPQQFAEHLENGLTEDEIVDMDPDQRDLTYTYNLIVADINSRSMFHIYKPVASERGVYTQEVAFGVHTLSSDGLDNAISLKDARLRYLFNENIGAYENNQISLEMLAERVMCDRVQAVQGDEMSAIFVERRDYHPVSRELGRIRYGTASITAFSVNSITEVTEFETIPIVEAILYETLFP